MIRDELIKLILVENEGTTDKNDRQLADLILKDFLVLRKSEVKIIDFTGDCAIYENEERVYESMTPITQVIVISKEK